jgi:tetratricopeptide (TPR) repeat protein
MNDIDPVAEAEVYEAYGRRQQAIDILREGLQQNPNNFKAHQMLQKIDPTYKGTVPSEIVELNPNCKATFNSKAGWNCSCIHKHPLVCAKAYKAQQEEEPFQEAISLLLSMADNEARELAEEPFHAGVFVDNDRIKKYREAAEALKKDNRKLTPFTPKTYVQHGSGMVPVKDQTGDWVQMDTVRKWIGANSK